jgi:hypothetical protein
MLVSPNMYSPPKPESRASSICSRSKSPSIANLSHLSVVKQRLAQIERNQLPHSAPTSPVPASRYSSAIRTRSLRVQIRSPEEVTSPASPTSILESYGEPSSTTNGVRFPTTDNPALVKWALSDNQVPLNQTMFNESPPSSDVHESLELLTDIRQMISTVAQQQEGTNDTLTSIRSKLSLPTKSDSDFATITQALGDIDGSIMKLITEIRVYRDADSKAIASKGEKSSASCDWDKVRPYYSFPQGIVDFPQLDRILDLLREDNIQRSMQAHQQTDSVRYLNELNSASIAILA